MAVRHEESTCLGRFSISGGDSGCLQSALLNRSYADVIHHSGQGAQYSSDEFQKVCEAHGIKQSMGSIGGCYDNAQAESWFVALKRQCVLRNDPLVPSKVLRYRVIESIES